MMRAEDIKRWHRGILVEEAEGTEGAGYEWRSLVQLLQTIWEHGEIPPQMTWVINVLAPREVVISEGLGCLSQCGRQ